MFVCVCVCVRVCVLVCIPLVARDALCVYVARDLARVLAGWMRAHPSDGIVSLYVCGHYHSLRRCHTLALITREIFI